MLHAAERQARIGRHHGVDEDHAGLDLRRRSARARAASVVHALAPRPKGESLATPDRLVDVAHAEQDGHRAEQLLVVGGRVGRDVGEHGRRVKNPGPVEPLAAGEQPRAGGDRAARTCSSIVSTWFSLASGPMSVAGVHRVADLERLDAFDEAALELVGDRLVHDEALGRDARLAVVDRARLDRGPHRGVEVGARHHDERVAAAELEHVFLITLPAALATALAGAGAAGERHGGDPRVVDDALHLVGPDQQRLEAALGEAGAAEEVLDGQRALRHVRGVLEQPDVAGHQRRRGEAEHLPEREVPRHDREHRAERLVGDEAPRGAGLDGLVGEEPLGVLGVVAAAQRALRRLLDGGLERLAHLGHHQAAERVLLGLEDLGGLEHHPPAVGVSSVQGFDGKTTGSLSLTGKAIFRRPALPLHNNIYHVPFGDADAIEQQLCIAREVGNDIAAVVMEPIQGEAGAIVPPDDSGHVCVSCVMNMRSC